MSGTLSSLLFILVRLILFHMIDSPGLAVSSYDV